MKKSVLIFLLILAQSLCAMQDDHDRPFSDRDADAPKAHLLPEDGYEMREYREDSEPQYDSAYRERDLYANEFARLNRKINTLMYEQNEATRANKNCPLMQCAVSGMLACGVVIACAYMNQSTNDAVRCSTNIITQRINNLAAQCTCPQIPAYTTQTPNTTINATTNPLYTPTDTAFLNMIRGNMSTNQTKD